MARRHTFTASLCWGGDVQTGEAEVTVSYGVEWGRPAQGPSYDCGGTPADPDEIVDVEILTVDDVPWAASDWQSFGINRTDAADTLIEKLVDENWDHMVENAIEDDHNGRIWRDEPWTPDATPIYDNRRIAA